MKTRVPYCKIACSKISSKEDAIKAALVNISKIKTQSNDNNDNPTILIYTFRYVYEF